MKLRIPIELPPRDDGEFKPQTLEELLQQAHDLSVRREIERVEELIADADAQGDEEMKEARIWYLNYITGKSEPTESNG